MSSRELESVAELGPALLRYFSAAGPREVAADLTQECLVRLLDKLQAGAFDPARGHLRMYAYGIARRVRLEAAKRHFRSGNETLGESDWESLPDPQPGAEARLAEHERSRALRRALARLPDPEGEILRLHLDRELGLTEIAGILELNLNTVKSHIYRAKARLREALVGENAKENPL